MYVKIIHELDAEQDTPIRKRLLHIVEGMCPEASVHYERRDRTSAENFNQSADLTVMAVRREPLPEYLGMHEARCLYVKTHELSIENVRQDVIGVIVAVGGHQRCDSVRILLFSEQPIPETLLAYVKALEEHLSSWKVTQAPADTLIFAAQLTDAVYYSFEHCLLDPLQEYEFAGECAPSSGSPLLN